MPEIDLRECTGDPNSCGVVAHIFELDEIIASVTDIDPLADREREILANFVTACVKGNCPGKDLEFARTHMNQPKP